MVKNLEKCQGDCAKLGKCKGAIRKVRITNQERTVNWGEHFYCQTAILTDRAKGFRVEVVKEHLSVADFLAGNYEE